MSREELSFYTRAVCLDVLKNQTDPNDETADVLAQALQEESYCHYFFHDLDSPVWLKPLKERGIFDIPPEPIPAGDNRFNVPLWDASEYLVRVAHTCPKEVVDIALGLDTQNGHVLGNLVQAALKIPPTEAVRIVPMIDKWLNCPFPFRMLEYSGQLMVHLAEKNE